MVVRCLDVNFSDALTANQFGFANQDINSNLKVIWVNHSRHMYHIQTAQISGRSFLNIYGLTFTFIGITGFFISINWLTNW